MVTIIMLTNRGHEEQSLSPKEAAIFIQKLKDEGHRFLVVDWDTKEMIPKSEFDNLEENQRIALIPMIAGGKV